MKYTQLLYAAVVWCLASTLSYSQTITTGSPSQTRYCMGDSITIPFTVTGTFVSGNAFVLQLSDSIGGFTSGFRNLATVYGTTSGEIKGRIADNIIPGIGFRFRVISTNPQVNGSDNGTDISISRRPQGSLDTPPYGVTGISIQPGSRTYDVTSYTWDFGSGASPSSATDATPRVTYSTPGEKTLTLNMTSAGGCTVSTTQKITVAANNPTIPADVQIIQSGTTILYDTTIKQQNQLPPTYWVCPGASLRLKTFEYLTKGLVIYTEVGSNVVIDGHARDYTIYLKTGATATTSDRGLIVAETGSEITTGGSYTKVDVPSIIYDYSNVPAGGCPSLAPYTVNISPISSEISKPEQGSGDSQSFWLHNGADLEASGNGNTFYVEQGADLSITGDNSTVYLKDGASLSVSGLNTRIFYEMGSTIISEGTNAILLPSSGITFINSTSSVEQNGATTGERSLQLTPNPATTELRIESSGEGFDYLEMVDATGRRVLELRGVRSDERIDVSALPRGTYFMRAVAASSEVIRRVVLK